MDLATNIVLMFAGCAIVWTLLSERRPSTAPTTPREALPSSPISLAGAWSVGNLKARVAILEFADFQCPFCARFVRDTLPELKRRYVNSGRVLLVFKHLPLKDIHPLAVRAAELAECAGRQGRFWETHDSLFELLGKLSDSELDRASRRAGVDHASLTQCLGGDAGAQVRRNAAEAGALGLTGTPTFFVGFHQADGGLVAKERLSGALPIAAFAAALDPLLATE